MSARKARQWLGAMLREWPHYRRVLHGQDDAWLALCNRGEELEPAPTGGRGYRCLWPWTSDLHAPKLLPGLGKALMRRALAEHPVARADAPLHAGPPQVSFIIGHRGESRLPLLLATVESIAAQQGAAIECIVVEQADTPLARDRLPTWVRKVHTPLPRPDMAYSRAWAFNIGVRHAKAPLLVLHDNDMLVPTDYASRVLEHAQAGYELINLKRFVFYLSEAHSRGVVAGSVPLTAQAPEAITQNLEGGGSVAIAREAYERIGGMDESFLGWGGEDNEFWERGQTLAVWPWAYLPILHLWHAPQPGKQASDNPTLAHYERLSAISPRERIERLRRRPAGLMQGPVGAEGAS